MMTIVAIVHIIVALLLILLVLLQDSKSDGALGMGGTSNANSILGATGAQSLASKVTVAAAIVFAFTCLGLTYFSTTGNKSVVDSMPLPTAPVQATPVLPETVPATGATAPATQAAPAAATAPAAAPAPATK